MAGLDRFVEAQRGVYPQALEELRRGLKTSHWMWFVFPQIAGLGRSAASRHFAIRNLGEARAYLDNGLLGTRLREATALVGAWAGRRTLDDILGPVDSLKFISAMTLFELAAGEDGPPDFSAALEALCAGARDSRTLNLIAQNAA